MIAPSANGERQQIAQNLILRLSEGYKPSLPLWATGALDMPLPQIYLLRDVELMRIHPRVMKGLKFYRSGISGAEFWGGPNHDNPEDEKGLPICEENPVVGKFIMEQVQRYWDRAVPKLQPGDEYGWIAGEPTYKQEAGEPLQFDDMIQFSPRDVFLLTKDYKPVGIRVKNVRDKGEVKLWMGTKDVPAKGLWYAHEPRYNQFYGQSQLFSAWRPWRRLAWKDAAETVADTAIYRFGIPPLMLGYPDESVEAQPGVPNTTLDSEGNAIRHARDLARFIGELFKAGAAIGLPTTTYPETNIPKWTANMPQQTMKIDGLVDYCEYLGKEILLGIGVPPELIEAAETGSGYSGRSIPIEAFLLEMQHIADAFLWLFEEQILRPLVRWNFGPVKWQIKVKPLLMTKNKQRQGEGQPGQQPGAKPMPNPAQPEGVPNQPQKVPSVAAFSMDNLLITDRIRSIARAARERAMAA